MGAREKNREGGKRKKGESEQTADREQRKLRGQLKVPWRAHALPVRIHDQQHAVNSKRAAAAAVGADGARVAETLD